MPKLFGTDGVRGIANCELTPELALNLGRAGAYVLTSSATSAPKIMVATDTRKSADMLTAAISAGMCSVGALVYQAGVIPTPALAYLVRHYKLDAGVMITASHNPMADNGIKFFSNSGYKLPDELEEKIEELMDNLDSLPRPVGPDVGVIKPFPNAGADYTSYLLSTVEGLNLAGINIALDAANGATSHVATHIFESLGANVHVLFNKPDGVNINEDCGSTHMEAICEYVVENGMDIGLAFDGDGDRMLAVDEKGQLVDGDTILAICGYDLKQQNQLPSNAIVATTMSNQGLELMCKENGITLHRTDVGDRYVLEKMRADNLGLGGEQSGHVIFSKYSTTGDGIMSGLRLVEILARKRKPMSELRKVMEHFPQVLINVPVGNDKKEDWDKSPAITKVKADMEAKLGNEGRIMVRPSGTEALVRVMIEGRDNAEIQAMAEELAQIIRVTLV